MSGVSIWADRRCTSAGVSFSHDTCQYLSRGDNLKCHIWLWDADALPFIIKKNSVVLIY